MPDRALLRDAAAIAAAMIAIGASFGAITIAYGLPTWIPFAMSTVVFAGGAQFLAVGLLAAGNPIAAVLAGLLLNARHLPFGLAVAETVGPRRRDRLIGSHLMTDEVVAFTLAEKDPARRRRTYWIMGITLFTSWNLGTALGVLLGGATGDPEALGLDAAFPAGLLALIMPSLRDRPTRVVALAGAAVAVLLTPVLPAGLPVLCALLGLVTLVRPGRRGRQAGDRAEPSREATGRAEPSREATGRAEPSREATGRAEPSREATGRAEPSREATGRAEPSREATGRAEPSREATGRAEPSREATGRAEIDPAAARSEGRKPC